MKHNIKGKLSFGCVAIAAFVGCGGAGDNASADSEVTAAASDALNTVSSCRAERTACLGDANAAGRMACDTAFRACVGPLGNRRGVGDAGRGVRAPNDAGPKASGPKAAVEVCVTDLDDCLKSATPADTCALDAIMCLAPLVGGAGGGPARGGPPDAGARGGRARDAGRD